MGNVYLNKIYQGIGKKDELLEAKVFSDVLKAFIYKALVNKTTSKVPIGFDDVEDIKTCIKTTRSGIILGNYFGLKFDLN